MRHETIRLDNGMRVLVQDLPHAQTVAISAHVPAGPLYEDTTNAGVSHLLEHLHLAVTRRAPTRAAFLRQINRQIGFNSGFTREYAICVEFHLESSGLAAAVELLADILEPREFATEIIESERRLLIDEFQNPEWQEWPYWAMQLYGMQSPHYLYAQPDQIRKLSPEIISDFELRAFRPERMIVAIAGRIDQQALSSNLKSLERIPSTLNAKPLELIVPKLTLPCVKRIPFGSPRKRIWLGFARMPPIALRDRILSAMLELALWGPHASAYERLRYIRASTYHFGFDVRSVGVLRILTFTAGADRAHRDVAIREGVSVLKEVATRPFEGETFEAHRARFYFQNLRSLESPPSIASHLAQELARESFVPPCTIDEAREIVRSTSAEELCEVAASFVKPESLLLLFDGNFRRHDTRRVRDMVKEIIG